MGENPRTSSVLLIDDDADFCADLAAYLHGRYDFRHSCTADAGLELVSRHHPDLLLLDVDFDHRPQGLEVLQQVRNLDDPPAVIMLTGDRRPETIVRAIKAGAFDYVAKPPRLEELIHRMETALADRRLRRSHEVLLDEVHRLRGDLVAVDPAMLAILKQVGKVAPTNATVLIVGETGTGKEMIARRVHALSPRNGGPFVAVNCAALPEQLAESELFGHERGSFTGAERRRAGKFEVATGGTLFLDEIGEAPDFLQTKLLRVLEEREFWAVGSDRPSRADVRVIAASSRDLETRVAEGRFRGELLYRLGAFPLRIPALRERPLDVSALAHHFLKRYAVEQGKQIRAIDEAAARHIAAHAWPGNVRHLRNAIERAVILCDGERLELAHILTDVAAAGDGARLLSYGEAKDAAVNAFQRAYVTAQLARAGGNVAEAAELSGIRRQVFWRIMKQLGIGASREGEA
ncbi:MAG: sigma-54 dependent transcriptional regulator [Candidatus Krumholzibacteriia bacterium]